MTPEQASRVLAAFREAIDNDSSPEMKTAFRRAAFLYLNFIQRRYLKAARGDGTWPDLSYATKRNRVSQRKALQAMFAKRMKAAMSGVSGSRKLARMNVISGMNFEILRDTSLLFNSLSQTKPNSIEEFIPFGIRVGTAVKYAKYHQEGGPRLPKREIFVPPDSATQQMIEKEIRDGLYALAGRIIRETGNA